MQTLFEDIINQYCKNYIIIKACICLSLWLHMSCFAGRIHCMQTCTLTWKGFLLSCEHMITLAAGNLIAFVSCLKAPTVSFV